MKLLILFFLFFSVDSLQAAPRTKTFHRINCKGSYYLAPNQSQAPTKLWLSALGAQAGEIIGITEVGRYQYYPGSPDTYGTGVVFVDANENFLYPGPRSTTYQVYTYPDIGGDVGVSSDPHGFQHGIEVPAGAVALLIAPPDSYTLDNVDTDGDYGVEIEVPYLFPFDIFIHQTGHLATDLNNDGRIDIIPGDQADVVAYLARNVNAAHSIMVWQNEASGQFLTRPPNLPDSDSVDGHLSFGVNRIPTDSAFLGNTTITITLLDSNDIFLSEDEIRVNVLPSPIIDIYQNGVQNPENLPSDGIVDLLPGLAAEIRVDTNFDVDLSKSVVYLVNDISQQLLEIKLPQLPLPLPRGTVSLPFTVPSSPGFAGKATGTLVLRNANNVFVSQKIFKVNVAGLGFKIFQVIENPDLENDQVIDLVAGKNADVEVTFDVSADVTKGEVTFISGGTTIPCSSDFTFVGPGKGTIHVNPIPAGSTRLNTEMKFTLLNSSDETILESSTQVNIQQTKPIKLGYVPIFSKTNAFATPKLKDMEATIASGTSLVRAMYPVAENEISATLGAFAIPGSKTKNTGIDDDWEELAETISDNAGNFGTLGITNVIGLVGKDYFIYHGYPGSKGVSAFGNVSAQVTAGWSLAVPHELGHIYCLRYDTRTDCLETPGVIGHYPRENDLFQGFMNNNFQEILGFSRGRRKDQKNLMVEFTPNVTSGYWFGSYEYLKIFKKNLIPPVTRSLAYRSGRLFIAGSVDLSGNFEKSSVYIADFSREISTHSEGQYIVEAKNIEHNIISSNRYSSKRPLGAGDFAQLVIAVPLTQDLMFVEIYLDLGNNAKRLIGSIVVPADLIEHEFHHIPDQAIKTNPLQVRHDLQLFMDEYKSEITSKNIVSAKDVLVRKIYPLIRDSVTDSFEQTSLLDVGRLELSELVLGSLVILDSNDSSVIQEPINLFVKLQNQGQAINGSRAQLKVELLRQPDSKEVKLIHEIFFDGIKIVGRDSGRFLEAESLKLIAGLHEWQVRSYLVPRKKLDSVQNAIKSWQSEHYRLISELEGEGDLEKRIVIERRIASIVRRIADLKSQLRDSMSEIGTPAKLKFEVL